jgi:hypothetical protein
MFILWTSFEHRINGEIALMSFAQTNQSTLHTVTFSVTVFPFHYFDPDCLHFQLQFRTYDMASTTSYSLLGKGVKANTAEDVQIYVEELSKLVDLESLTLGGNTFGVEAAKAIAETLKDKTKLKVKSDSTIDRVYLNDVLECSTFT